ncbi:hypothetical protein [Moraxella lacunata]
MPITFVLSFFKNIIDKHLVKIPNNLIRPFSLKGHALDRAI